MASKQSILKITLYIILPLIAIGSLGVSSYLWFKALEPEIVPPPVVISTQKKKPELFSPELQDSLMVVLSEFGIQAKDIKRVKPKDPKDAIRFYYTVRIPEKTSLMLINLKVTTMVKDMGGSVFQGIESSNGRSLTLTLGSDKTATDVVLFRKIPGVEVKKARMAIIIDDIGVRQTETAEKFCGLEQIVTLSILPFRPYTEKMTAHAQETGTPYMLHMPMEPKSEKANPGKGVLLAHDEKSVVVEKLRKAFRSVAGAGGLNNHMGSKITENVRTMEIVMEFLEDNNLFFIDSRTSLNTTGYSISQKTGVKSAIIDGYLDVENDETAIEKRLERLAGQALTNGRVLVIGHDRPLTLRVLERKLPELEKRGITFVAAVDLIR